MHVRRFQSSHLLLALLPAFVVTVATPDVRGDDVKSFRWVLDGERQTADLLLGDEPVLQYFFPTFDASTPESAEVTTKAYHHVFGPGTGKRITKGAGGLYPHHRGLFVGWNKTHYDGKSSDFWHCKPGSGVHQQHKAFVDMKVDEQGGTMTAQIDWIDANKTPVITETRTVQASTFPTDSGEHPCGWQIDWSTVLASHRGDIVLDGDRQHAGFQFRAAQAVAESEGARYIRPQGFPEQPEAYQVNDRTDPDKHVDLGWLAMTYELDGSRYTIEYFEDPGLPKPSKYSERPYGRFGAFFKTTLTADKPLTMRYRVLVTTGPAPSREQIQARYDAFVAELKASQ